ncbi:hypothetical protein BpHYR1_051738, partial [Brachionus plicatilis]
KEYSPKANINGLSTRYSRCFGVSRIKLWSEYSLKFIIDKLPSKICTYNNKNEIFKLDAFLSRFSDLLAEVRGMLNFHRRHNIEDILDLFSFTCKSDSTFSFFNN